MFQEAQKHQAENVFFLYKDLLQKTVPTKQVSYSGLICFQSYFINVCVRQRLRKYRFQYYHYFDIEYKAIVTKVLNEQNRQREESFVGMIRHENVNERKIGCNSNRVERREIVACY